MEPTLLNELLGKRDVFPFPKSVYAVRDALAAVVRNRPEALIVDFFAGSGTTFHATCLLNVADGGTRRSILVTNNEVSSSAARRLHQQGFHRGDPEYEKQGIFEQVTRPRCETALTGLRPDGREPKGTYQDRRPLADGFEENLDLFRLTYLDPNEVDLGTQFESIHPVLWLAAGGLGRLPDTKKRRTAYVLPDESTYGVLFKESRFRDFLDALEKRPQVTHVWLVTDSEEALSEMTAALPEAVRSSMLYHDYLRNFPLSTARNL